MKIPIVFAACVLSFVNSIQGALVTRDFSAARELSQFYNKPIAAILFDSDKEAEAFALKLSGDKDETVGFCSREYILFVGQTALTHQQQAANAFEEKKSGLHLISEKGESWGMVYEIPSADHFFSVCSSMEKTADQIEYVFTVSSPIEQIVRNAIVMAKSIHIHSKLGKLFELALRGENGIDIGIEGYAFFLQRDIEKSKHIKQALLAKDPDNHLGVHYQLACIEFQDLTNRSEQTAFSLIEEFLKNPSAKKEERARIHLLAAEHMLSTHRIKEALTYVQKAKLECEHTLPEVDFVESQITLLLHQDTFPASL